MTKQTIVNKEEQYLPNPDQTHFNRSDLVILSGCSGGGKSSLLSELSQRAFGVIMEPGREIVKEQKAIGGTALPWVDLDKFLLLALSRYIYHFNSSVISDRHTFADRGIIDSVKTDRQQEPCFANAAKKFRYNQKVFLVPTWKEIYVQDQERQHGFEDATAEYHELLEKYQDYSYETVIVPKTDVKARADFVLAMLAQDKHN
ncbi:MAG: AAA family ATPase [Oligoflexales bacterium]|nr:AAA family ATPase [Oligoflexales bacterium]